MYTSPQNPSLVLIYLVMVHSVPGHTGFYSSSGHRNFACTVPFTQASTPLNQLHNCHLQSSFCHLPHHPHFQLFFFLVLTTIST